MRNKPYVVTVMMKLLDKSWSKVCYRYATPEDMIWYAKYYAGLAEMELNEGKILDYEISY